MANVTHFSAVSSTWSNIDVDATLDVTLTEQQAADAGIIVVSAVGAGGKAIIFPTAIANKLVVVYNDDAADSVTVKVGAAGVGVAVAATKTAILRCTTTDFVRVTADA